MNQATALMTASACCLIIRCCCLLLLLQLIMFTFELQRRLRLQGAPVDCFAVHPGKGAWLDDVHCAQGAASRGSVAVNALWSLHLLLMLLLVQSHKACSQEGTIRTFARCTHPSCHRCCVHGTVQQGKLQVSIHGVNLLHAAAAGCFPPAGSSQQHLCCHRWALRRQP